MEFKPIYPPDSTMMVHLFFIASNNKVKPILPETWTAKSTPGQNIPKMTERSFEFGLCPIC